MNNLILIGMMGCGKSTVGGLLARRLGWELADTDSLIEAREHHPGDFRVGGGGGLPGP